MTSESPQLRAAAWQPPSAEEMQVLVPGYDILALIGRGGMGAVYHARQRSLKRDVAIKILPPVEDDGDMMNFAGRFKAEAESMARLNHPGIISVYDAGETPGGLLYIVMEYVQGTDVARMIATAGRLPPEHAHAIAANVCDALSYAHAHGLIHRDIKPANIMVDSQGRVKVADFGLAKAVHEENGFTRTNMAVGTPHFVAPEALVPGMSMDGRADLYAVGVMLYQMLTGEIPRGAWETPSHLVPGIDPRFDEIVVKAMRVDRESRHSDAAELRTHLDTLLIPAALPAPAATASPQASVQIPHPPTSSPSRFMFPILSAITAVAATAGVAFILGKSQPAPAVQTHSTPSVQVPAKATTETPAASKPILKEAPIVAAKLPDPAPTKSATPPPISPATLPVEAAAPMPTLAAAAPVLVAQANTTPPLEAPPAAPAASTAIPAELAALQQQYEKLLAEKVTGVYEAATTVLNTGYTGGLDRGMAEAQKSGQLDAVLAFEEEKKHLAAEKSIPTTDDDKTPEALKKLRAIYRTSAAKLEAERSANQTALVIPYTTRLKQLETDLTKQARIPDAKAVKEYREGLGSVVALPTNTSKPSKPETSPTKSSKKDIVEYLTSYRWYFTREKDSKAVGYLITFKSDGTVDQPKAEDKWVWEQKEKDEILLNGAPFKIAVGQMILERPDTKLGSRYLHRDEPIAPEGQNIKAAQRFKGHRYLFVNEMVSWEAAQKKAGELGGYLACLSTPEELKFVASLRGSSRIWLGMKRAENGVWGWVDGSAITFDSMTPGALPRAEQTVMMLPLDSYWTPVAPIQHSGVMGYVIEWDE